MGENNGIGYSCCNDPQYAFIAFYLFYIALVFISWRTQIAKPMRLIAVFLHEYSHATACWITGGSVREIQVYDNEGGVTRYIGGCRVLIIPAGYVGCAIFGMIFVVLSGGRRTATAAAGVFTAALLISLCYSPNKTMVYLNLAYAFVTGAFIAVEWLVFTPILQYLILFYGVFVSTYAIFDIYDDLIRRTSNRSDAWACYELMPCCLPKCVGLQWALLAVVLQLFGAWMALALMSDECRDESWWRCSVINLNPMNFDFDWDHFWDGGP